MSNVTRRTVVQGIGMATTAALVNPGLALPSTPTLLPEPALDIEAWFGPATMANIKRIFALGLVNIPEHYAGHPALFGPDGRFNLSAEFRCALARLLACGPDVLMPDEPGMHRHYKSVLRKVSRGAGVPMYGFIGELAEPPHRRMILLSRDEWVWHCARKNWPIRPFRAYQWLADEEVKGLINPTGNAPPRFANMKPPPHERAVSLEERMAIFDAESAKNPFFEG